MNVSWCVEQFQGNNMGNERDYKCAFENEQGEKMKRYKILHSQFNLSFLIPDIVCNIRF
jgi:hypothetical protein